MNTQSNTSQKAVSYSYCILKYVHDFSAGESINVGVLLFAPDAGFLEAHLETRYAHLKEIFADFHGESFRAVLNHFRLGLERMQKAVQENLSDSSLVKTLPKSPSQVFYESAPANLQETLLRLWPDKGLSFQSGEIRVGITRNPQATLDDLFRQLVTDQRPRERDETKRTDEDVWNAFAAPLKRLEVTQHLLPRQFITDTVQVQFEHTFKNGSVNVLHPITLDYARVEGIQNKASRWVGIGVALEGLRDLGKIYILLGKPQLEAHQDAYVRAKKLLDKIPVPHKLVEEEEAEQFAQQIAQGIKEHEQEK